MSDTSKLVMEQIDEGTGKAISRITVELFGDERDTANAMGVGFAEAILDQFKGFTVAKAEGIDPVAMLKEKGKA